MIKIKTSELTGAALDWAVAKCEGLNPNIDPEVRKQYVGYRGFAEGNGFGCAIKQYSTYWEYGGQIIEREIFKLFRNVGGTFTAQIKIRVPYYSPTYDYDIGTNHVISCSGPTPLIAAMRCLVASKLGDEVEIPEELLYFILMHMSIAKVGSERLEGLKVRLFV